MTSFGAVAFVRTRLSRALGIKKIKVGHAGTLDPLATGVLVVCTGHATKSIDRLQLMEKEYVATMKFGATTASYDMEHPENEHFSTENVTRENILDILSRFTGDISQVPPAFSACSVDGKRAYRYARQNEEVTLQPKTIHIESIDLLDFSDDAKTAQMRIVCGKGTYIRALARDMGAALQSGAYLTQLCRTRVGDYSIADSIAIDDFETWLHEQYLEPYEQ